MSSTKRVLVNTGFLYGKMLISMSIALYSTRIVLNALGADDFGTFNLVAGVIAMLSFLNGAMSVSTQRYISFYIGANNTKKLNSVFKSSVSFHLAIGVIVIIVFEIIGLYLFSGFLNIPADRISSAKMVYHFMVVSTFFTINAVPYDAAIIAHEKLKFEAIVGVFEAISKLGIAISLTYANSDRLIQYGGLIAGLTVLIRIIKSIYCYSNFSECKSYRKAAFNWPLVKEMFSFSGWNMFGALCGLGRNQGIAIILNLFFGTIVNAAYGIAYQVNAQLATFSANMLKALNPQIIKSEGSGDRQKMLHLSLVASKYGFFLLALFAIPLIFQMPYVLDLWLTDVPEYTITFCRLILLNSLVFQLTNGSYTALQATGKIKLYQPITGTLLLLNIPVSWILLKYGLPPYSVLISMISIEFLAMGSKLYFWVTVAGLKLVNFIKTVLIRSIVPTFFSVLLVVIVLYIFEPKISFYSLLIFCLLWATLYLTLIYVFGLSYQEKDVVLAFVKKKIKRM